VSRLIERAIDKLVEEDREDFLDFDLGDTEPKPDMVIYRNTLFIELRRNVDLSMLADRYELPELGDGSYRHWWTHSWEHDYLPDPFRFTLSSEIPEYATWQKVEPILVVIRSFVFKESLDGFVAGDRAWVRNAEFENLL